jgi:hypothetical protein
VPQRGCIARQLGVLGFEFGLFGSGHT